LLAKNVHAKIFRAFVFEHAGLLAGYLSTISHAQIWYYFWHVASPTDFSATGLACVDREKYVFAIVGAKFFRAQTCSFGSVRRFANCFYIFALKN
jgi:hypothetical protein